MLLGLESLVDMSLKKYEASERDYYRLLGQALIDHDEAAALLAGINPRFVGDILHFEEADQSGRLAAFYELVGRKPEQFPSEMVPLVREAKKKIRELKENIGLPHRSGPTRMLGLASVSSGVMPPFLYRAE